MHSVFLRQTKDYNLSSRCDSEAPLSSCGVELLFSHLLLEQRFYDKYLEQIHERAVRKGWTPPWTCKWWRLSHSIVWTKPFCGKMIVCMHGREKMWEDVLSIRLVWLNSMNFIVYIPLLACICLIWNLSYLFSTVAFAYKEQMVNEVPVDNNDVKVDAILMEDELVLCCDNHV